MASAVPFLMRSGVSFRRGVGFRVTSPGMSQIASETRFLHLGDRVIMPLVGSQAQGLWGSLFLIIPAASRSVDGTALENGSSKEERVVIEPRKGRRERPIPAGVIVGFTSSDLAVLRSALRIPGRDFRRLDFARLWACSPPWEGVALAGPALGAPAAVVLLERLIALGARWILSVGSCGSLSPEAPIGTVVVPTHARCEEGTSQHYRAPWVRMAPDSKLLDSLRLALRREGVTVREGGVWTTDAPFRETLEKIRSYSAEGDLVVDMETSALWTVASFRRTSLATALVVSDELWTLKWRKGFSDPRFRKGLGCAARAAASALGDRVQGSGPGRRDSGAFGYDP